MDDSGMPIDRINTFVITDLIDHSSATANQKANIIIHIERWAASRNIDLQDEMAGSFLGQSNLFASFIKHLQTKVVDVQGETVVQMHPEKVCPDFFNHRLAVTVSYFTDLFDRNVARRRSNDPVLPNWHKSFENLIKRLGNRKIKGKTQSLVHGLTPLQQKTLFYALEKDGVINWNKETRIRNRLIILILYETGVRRGELLSLTIENCHTREYKPYIYIKQNVKYPDPRKDIPDTKTLERIIPISKELAKMIDEYCSIRSLKKEARKQPPFLLLATRSPCLPMSKGALNNVFAQIRKDIPEIDRLRPHILRHTRMENLDRHLLRQGYTDDQKSKIKNLIGGWSPNSKTGENYEKLSTEEQAYDALSALHIEIERGIS
ncbi:tyrosine-type recombinase/integrase [Endozoicomonas acroporae]|uniref:tyrosine-type recombinase/integrase n=1 Tax=Endozoicomonas acroporae TaxID=1701104 RepID=UPI0015E0F708|nr:site-specific integrase [Endozoicomonas acroporae]